MLKINYNKALEVFRRYISLQKVFTRIPHETDNIKKRMGIDGKYAHSIEVVRDGTRVIKNLNFNPDTIEFCKVAFLDHDIGRFKQMVLTGSFNDSDLFQKMKVKNHGLLGGIVLSGGILKEQIPDTRVYDDAIIKIVENHVDGYASDSQLKLLGTDFFEREDIYDVLASCDEETKQNIIAIITQIVQDVDRLDIYHQILSDRWNPSKCDLDIDDEIFRKFYAGEYLNMSELRANGQWNSNVGELIRLSFINQIRLYSVAKMILDENIILELKEKRNNPKAKDAFDYTHELLKELVNSSKDGITISRKTLTKIK